jgi:hypothetical protein
MARFSHVGGARARMALLSSGSWRPGPADPLLRSSSQREGVLRFAAESRGRAACFGNRVGTWVVGTTLGGRRFSVLGSRPNNQFPTHWKHGASSPKSPSGQATGEQFSSPGVSQSEVGTGYVLRCANSSGGATNRSAPSSSSLELAVSTGLSRNYTFGRGTNFANTAGANACFTSRCSSGGWKAG